MHRTTATNADNIKNVWKGVADRILTDELARKGMM